MKIIFVRHGKDDEKYRGGWSNLDLVPEGRKQAEHLAAYIKEKNSVYHVNRIVSSDLQRAVTTADCIAQKLGLPVGKEEKLREMNNGVLAGMLNEEALMKYPGLFFSSLEMDEPYPNGESPNDFYHRIEKWFVDFIREYENFNGNVLVVTHGGVINIIYHIVKGLEWSNRRPSFRVANCSIHVLDVDRMEFEMENKTVKEEG